MLQDLVLVRGDIRPILHPSFIVESPLFFLFFGLATLVEITHGFVLLTTGSHLVGKLGVLLRDLDLSLKTLLLVVKFAEPVLQHLGLDK